MEWIAYADRTLQLVESGCDARATSKRAFDEMMSGGGALVVVEGVLVLLADHLVEIRLDPIVHLPIVLLLLLLYVAQLIDVSRTLYRKR